MKYLASFLFLISFSLSPNVYATYSCSGVVKGVTIAPTGQVFAESIGSISWPRMCSVSETFNGVSPEACRAVFSTLLTAQATGKEVSLSFDDDAGGGTCTSHPAWGALTGWYFGPTLK